MDQDKIGKFIKDLRKQHHLTQQQLADKYGITYQAVSNGENGKNLPDISLIKQMSKDFNVNIDDLLDGKLTKSKKKKTFLLLSILLSIILLLLIVIGVQYLNRDNTFEFKTLSSSCDYFTISGSMAYNKKKSSIYISSVSTCGVIDNTKYKKIECILYEQDNNTEIRIDTYNYTGKSSVSLEKFLQGVRFNVDNYSRICKHYKENSLYLQINATDAFDKVTSHKIPLTVEENCS